MSEPENHGWTVGYGLGGAAVAALYAWKAECTTGGSIGQVQCTNYLGLPTKDLNQLETLIAAVFFGSLFALGYEAYLWYKRKHAPPAQ